MNNYDTLDYRFEEGIGIITINRPEVLNALNGQVFTELEAIFQELVGCPEVRVVIITGAGKKAFAAGADVTEFAECSFLEARQISIRNNRVQNVISAFPRPTIAAVNGFALGGGLELAMCCDIRIASDNARFGQPEINLGFVPGGGGTQRLPRLVGIGIAKEMVYGISVISAQRAYEIGLVNKVVPGEELMDTATDMARKLAQKSQVILEYTKLAVDQGIELDLKSGLKLETELWAESFATEDHREGIAAFLGKRDAKFRDR